MSRKDPTEELKLSEQLEVVNLWDGRPSEATLICHN